MGLAKQHQMFVQCLMAQGALPVNKVEELYNTCGQAVVEACGVSRAREISSDTDGLISVADLINKELQRVGMQLKTVYSPFEKDSFWGLVNTADDPPSQLATELSVKQRRYFFGIVNDLIENADLSLVEVQNMGPEFDLTVSAAGQTVQSLHKGQWLKIMKRSSGPSKVVFGVKSLLELPNVRAWAMSGPARSENAAAARSGTGVDDDDDDDDDDDGEGDDEEVDVMEDTTAGGGQSRSSRPRKPTPDDVDSNSDTPPVAKRKRGSGRTTRQSRGDDSSDGT
jgi:Nse1 non-SMC component of SMC5-6 complex